LYFNFLYYHDELIIWIWLITKLCINNVFKMLKSYLDYSNDLERFILLINIKIYLHFFIILKYYKFYQF